MKINVDAFNSEIFGLTMGNIAEISDAISEQDVEVLEKTAKNQGIQHLTAKISTGNKESVNSFLRKGFAMTDTLLEYVFLFDKATLPEMSHKIILRDFKDDDLQELMRIASTSFTYDRFHSDVSLDSSLCDKYYEQWIYNSCHGFADKVIVAEFEGRAVGFTTGKVYQDSEYGHLVLSAVSGQHRGLGIYTSMIYEGVKWLRGFENLKGVVVGTQINNIAVQKAWIHLGFSVNNSEYVLQKYIG